MGALTVGFIIADYYFNYGLRVTTYIFLGSITTILFYVMCLYKFEIVNWVFLGIVVIYVFFSLISIYFRKADILDASDMCDPCEIPIDECEIPEPEPKPCGPKKPEPKPCGPKKPEKPKC